MTEDSGPSGVSESCSKAEPSGDTLSSQRVFKKSSPNNKLTLYLSSRDLVVSSGKIDRLQGVLLVDPQFIEDRKVYGQITLTFRYGREDEEVMGLKFCNEAVMCLAQLYPAHPGVPEGITPLQEALIKRLGPNAYPFNMEITPLAPPSVQLVPAKEYNGAPIGTSYDVRAYVADRVDEKLQRRTTVRMGIRVVQRVVAPPSPYDYNPNATKDKNKHKISLFGCRSAPLESSKIFNQQIQHQQKPKSVDMGLENKNSNNDLNKHSLLLSSEPAIYENRNTGEHKSPSRVTFNEGNKDGSNCLQGAAKYIDDDEDDDMAGGCNKEAEGSKVHGDSRKNSAAAALAEIPAPHAIVEKQFLLSDGRIELEASLDKAVYHHGEEIQVTVQMLNKSNKTIRRIKVFVVQHVDVCMFSNGKFKNVVAMINSKEDCPVTSGRTIKKTYSLLPIKSSTKNWIALEDSYTKTCTNLASSVASTSSNPDDRNVFAIYVSYYVKVKLILSVMGGDVSLKLPFTLMHICSDFDPDGTLTRMVEAPRVQQELKEANDDEAVKPEKDGT